MKLEISEIPEKYGARQFFRPTEMQDPKLLPVALREVRTVGGGSAEHQRQEEYGEQNGSHPIHHSYGNLLVSRVL